MGKVKKLIESELVGGSQSTEIYPVTSTKAVYDNKNIRLLYNATYFFFSGERAKIIATSSVMVSASGIAIQMPVTPSLIGNR